MREQKSNKLKRWMTTNNLSLKLSHLSRSKGDNAVKAAALQSCENLLDKRAGVVRNYPTDSVRPIWKQILPPADAPKWASDREKLWNKVEAREDEHNKAKSARLAHRLELDVPTTLPDARKIKLVQSFTEIISSRRELVADVALYPFKEGNEALAYAIILIATRPIGKSGFAKTKNRKADLGAQGKTKALRKFWEEFVNQALEWSRLAGDLEEPYKQPKREVPPSVKLPYEPPF